MNKSPKLIEKQVIQTLRDAVPLGEYRLFSASSQLPSGVGWGGKDCQCVVIAASAYNGSSLPSLPPTMTPSGTVFLWRAFRAGPGGSPPRKVDDGLYYTNGEGDAWSLHSKESPDHHKGIMSGSALAEIMQAYDLPSASSGTLAEYRAGGAWLDFERPFWKNT